MAELAHVDLLTIPAPHIVRSASQGQDADSASRQRARDRAPQPGPPGCWASPSGESPPQHCHKCEDLCNRYCRGQSAVTTATARGRPIQPACRGVSRGGLHSPCHSASSSYDTLSACGASGCANYPAPVRHTGVARCLPLPPLPAHSCAAPLLSHAGCAPECATDCFSLSQVLASGLSPEQQAFLDRKAREVRRRRRNSACFPSQAVWPRPLKAEQLSSTMQRHPSTVFCRGMS